MKQGSTLLKVVSIIMIVFAALGLLAGLIALIGGGAIAGIGGLSTDSATAGASVFGGGIAAILGIGVIIGAIVDLIIGIVGLKASKENGKHTGAFVLGVIGVVVAAIGLVSVISQGADGSAIAGNLFSLVLPILYLVGVMQTRQNI